MAEESATQASTSQQGSSQRSSEDAPKHPQVPAFSGLEASPHGDAQKFPILCPALAPGLYNLQNQEQLNRGAGIYAVPVISFMGQSVGYPPNTLIPLTYSLPANRTNSTDATTAGEEQQQVGQQQQPQQQQQQRQQQHPAAQRQVVVRRFQFAIQLDLLLILKLAAVIFLFNQDGSRQRLALLVFFASLIYLYQTGALTPLVRWLSQGMQRAAVPRARAENGPPAARHEHDNAPGAEVQREAENENQPANDGNQVAEDGHAMEPGAEIGGNRLWGIIKEIQLIVFGFITSLLPGFHNNLD
ncbi:hypothetical protein NMG60_11023786 [Bertholletia excelsa]